MATVQIKIVVTGGIRSDSEEAVNLSNSAEAYICMSEDIEHGSWQLQPEMNEHRAYASSVVYDNRMIVTGGEWTTVNVEKLYLSQENGHWTEPSNGLPFQGLFGHVCVAYRNCLLLIGRRSLRQRVNTIIYELQLERFFHRELATITPGICYHGAVRIGGKVFIIGGMERILRRNTVVEFDLQTNDWRHLKQLPYAVSHMATTVWGDHVVILGGRGNNGDVLNTGILYNVTAQTYMMLPDTRNNRCGCTAVTIRNRIIVMGGEDETGGALNTAECHTIGKTEWVEFPAMNEARAYATAVRCNIPWRWDWFNKTIFFALIFFYTLIKIIYDIFI